MMANLDQFEFNKVCRTCLSTANLNSLYDNNSCENSYADMLMLCTPVEYNENDGLPLQICTDCTNELKRSHTFALKCRESDTQLRNYIEKLVPQEYAKPNCYEPSRSLKDPLAISELQNELNQEMVVVKNELDVMCDPVRFNEFTDIIKVESDSETEETQTPLDVSMLQVQGIFANQSQHEKEILTNKRKLEHQSVMRSIIRKPSINKIIKLQNRDEPPGKLQPKRNTPIVSRDKVENPGNETSNSTLKVVKHYVVKPNKHSTEEACFKLKCEANKIFSNAIEEDFKEYIAMAHRLHRGQSPIVTKKLAYQFAKKNIIQTPISWASNQMADEDWLRAFCKRHPYISFQRLEDGEQDFFNNLSSAYRHLNNMHKGCVYNLAEIAFKTEHGVEIDTYKQVTAVCCINAAGRSIPPFLVFPGFDFKPQKLGAPIGSLSGATKDGSVNAALFLKILEHFVKFSKCSQDKPIVLITDYLEKYITIHSLEFAKDNGILFITVPPNNTNELQPLNKIVFDSLRRHYDHAVITFNNLAPLNIIDQLFWKCYHKAFTLDNITNSFKLTGIWPFQRNIYAKIR